MRGFVQPSHTRSILTSSVPADIWSRPAPLARTATMSAIGRRRSTSVRSLSSGGRRMWICTRVSVGAHT